MKRHYIILILLYVALNYNSYSSNESFNFNENEGIVNRRNNNLLLNHSNNNEFKTIKHSNSYNLFEDYLLLCKDQKKNVDLGIIESTLKPLRDCKQDFMFNALYKLSIPRNYADKFYNYFREKALQEQEETELRNINIINQSKETNSHKLLANNQQHNQDDASDDEPLEEIKLAASGSGSDFTLPTGNNNISDDQTPYIPSQGDLLAQEEILRKDILKTRDINQAYQYFILFYTHEDQFKERQDEAKYVLKAINASLGIMNHTYPKFTSKEYTNILKMYYTYYSHNGTVEIQISKHLRKVFLKSIIKNCDEEGKQLSKQFNFIKKPKN